ncbi:MAG: hypothetical protein HY017_11720 [Betaproteobacteria bacterium]|nr:hypothetical protein [Betaproteobacteria bacterium]
MAAEISDQLGVKPELIEGAGGVFDVVADGVMIFSKHRAGRFPESAEVLRALKEKSQ